MTKTPMTTALQISEAGVNQSAGMATLLRGI
jgi:hypothetical protein